MAGIKAGAVSIAVNAPNSATNRVLTSPGMQAECRQVAAQLQGRLASEVMRDGYLSHGEKSRRYPIVQQLPVAAAFNGTVRSGAAVKGASYGIPLRDARAALGNGVEWKE